MNCELMLTYDTPALRQTGSRNLDGSENASHDMGTHMKLVTKYQISAINSYGEKCDEKYLGRMDRGKTVYPLPLRGYNYILLKKYNFKLLYLKKYGGREPNEIGKECIAIQTMALL